MYDPSAPPLVSETLLKTRRTLDELSHRRSTTVQVQNKRKRVVRGEDVRIKRPEQFLTEYRIKEGSQNKMQRRRKNALRRNHPDVPKNSVKKTVGFIVRIHTGRHASDEIKLELRKMNLNHKYDGVFTILDENRIQHLKAFDSYVAYGYVTNKSVVELVHRRAFANISGVKKPLTDNMTVETMLGDKGILCLNDLSHEVFSVGPNFDAATKMLCTFKLSSPTGNYEKTILKINDSVEERGGFLGDEMDTFLNKIL